MLEYEKAGRAFVVPKRSILNFFVENVTYRYILAIQDSPFRSNKNHVHEFAGRASIARKIGKFSGISCCSEPNVGITGAALAD